MARLFRLLDKKRGDRRTFSSLIGSIGEAVFFSLLFLLGVASLAALVASHVLHPQPEAYAIGFGFWLLILVLSTFALVGGVGAVWTVLRMGTSVERRSALAQHASRLDLLDSSRVAPPAHYPSIPDVQGLTDSPGIELTYRLPSAQTPAWGLLAAASFCVLWNALVIALGVWAWRQPGWFLLAVLALFVAVGGWSIWRLLRQVYLHTGIGPTLIEVSDHPLLPGCTYQAALTQHGHLHIRWLELWLVCEEEAIYRQGTDVRTELFSVYQKRLYRGADFSIQPAEPFRTACQWEIPDNAMHSFHSANNAVHWRLVVKGQADGWPEFLRAFPIVVHPGEATSQPLAEVAPHSSEPLAAPAAGASAC